MTAPVVHTQLVEAPMVVGNVPQVANTVVVVPVVADTAVVVVPHLLRMTALIVLQRLVNASHAFFGPSSLSLKMVCGGKTRSSQNSNQMFTEELFELA